MDSMIKEINDNLRAIVDNINSNNSELEYQIANIQSQMDKKVDEAKKYKVEVDEAKRIIKTLEEENISLESSLDDLCEKFSKLDMPSLIETSKKEINLKINNNVREINKHKEHIQELTDRARTIKDLLINLKKEKSIKTDRLDNSTVLYDYYNKRISDVIDYAFDHSLNLKDYVVLNDEKVVSEIDNSDLDNTKLFNEIVGIDDEKDIDNNKVETSVEKDDESITNVPSDTTQVFDTIFNTDNDNNVDKNIDNGNNLNDENVNTFENIDEISDKEDSNVVDDIVSNDNNLNFNFNNLLLDNEVNEDNNKKELEFSDDIDSETSERLEKINDLFENFSSNKSNNSPFVSNNIENQIDNAYKDIFNEDLNTEKEDVKKTTYTDIFGNPIVDGKKEVNLENSEKNISDLFLEYGLDFSKYNDNQKDYLKQIYSEDKFRKILDVLKKYNIDLNNIYYSYNIFDGITDIELDNIINKLITSGQNGEVIGLILEKMVKVKKYDLDSAINSFGENINNIDMVDLIMKAKEINKLGGNN